MAKVMGMNSLEAAVLISSMIFILALILVTSLIAFKYWGPDGVIEKEQKKKELH